MNKIKMIHAAILIVMLHSMICQFSANAQSVTGSYSVAVNTPGTFGQVMLQAIDNWTDVMELSISGKLDASDMVYFSRLENMNKLDISQVEIKSVTGCEGLKNLQEVVLPQSVFKIEDKAFKDCISLSAINLDQIEEIGISAFYNCFSLNGDISLANLKTLGDCAFFSCSRISSIDMPVVTKIGSSAFNMSERLDYDMTESIAELSTVYMPSVESIGSSAFSNCSKIESISIPNCLYLGGSNSDLFYGGGCFSGCSSLSNVVLSEDLEYIPPHSFARTSIESIKLPFKLKTIGSSAFENVLFSKIEIPEGVQEIGNNTFKGCPLENIILPSTLEKIGSDAFYYRGVGNADSSYILKDVYCKGLFPIKTSTFDNDMVKSATLHVPSMSVSAYKLDENWYKFQRIEPIDEEISDITIYKPFTIIDDSGIGEGVNLSLITSALQQTAGHLTTDEGINLSLNSFTQNQNFKLVNVRDYDEDYNYTERLDFPYCTTLITNDEVKANSITTKIQLPLDEWSFISFPYDVNVSSIVVPDGIMWVVRRYNGSNRATMTGETWENVTPGQILNAGEGYIFHCVNDNNDSWSTDYVEFEFPAINNSNKNNIFSFTDVTKIIKEYPAEFSHNRGWNLIGNPYPAYMSSRYIDFQAPITVWNGDGYTAYSLADDEYILRPNEAFFVQCPVNTAQIIFFKDGRKHSFASSSNPYRSRAKMPQSTNRSILNFILSDDTYSDRTRLVLNETASCDYEIERDASKFMSNNETVPQLYIIDNGVKYAINERPLGAGEYTLGVHIGKDGPYNIAMNPKDSKYEVMLIDTQTNTITDLNSETYSFESKSQTENNRFYIKINAKGNQSSIEDLETNNIDFYVNGNRLYLDQDVNISLYSIDGKLVYSGIVDGSIELSSGIYILSINGITQKIAIK